MKQWKYNYHFGRENVWFKSDERCQLDSVIRMSASVKKQEKQVDDSELNIIGHDSKIQTNS